MPGFFGTRHRRAAAGAARNRRPSDWVGDGRTVEGGYRSKGEELSV